MDLTTKAATLELANPLMPGSGPLTGDDRRMISINEFGLGALVTKTIAPQGAKVQRPCIAGEKDVIYNSEMWSEYDSEKWENDFLPNVGARINTPIICSVGYDADDVNDLIPRLDPYAQAFELIPRYFGDDQNALAKMVGAARSKTDKPIWVKINAGLPDPVGFSKTVYANGAQGVVAVTSLGPNMVIDLKNRKPVVGTADGYVWTSGPSIKPLALATVHMIKEAIPEISVIGSGGVATADDVLEFLLVGADAVQMLSWAMLRGKKAYKKIIDDLPAAMEMYGFSSIEEVKATKLGKLDLSLEPSFPVIDHTVCTKCGICTDNCPYFAMTMDDIVVVDKKSCFGCGLCESRCPVRAISGVL